VLVGSKHFLLLPWVINIFWFALEWNGRGEIFDVLIHRCFLLIVEISPDVSFPLLIAFSLKFLHLASIGTLWLTCHLLLKFPAYFQRGKWSLQLFWCFVSNLNTCSPRSAYRKRQVWSSRYRRFGPWWVLLRWFWFLSSWSIPKKYPHLNGGPLTFGFAESDVIIRIKNLGVYKGDI